MPVTRKRPHVIDLINIGCSQKAELNETKKEALQKPVEVWLKSKSDRDLNATPSVRDGYFMYDTLLKLSRRSQRLLHGWIFTGFSYMFWPLAVSVVLYEARQSDLSIENSADFAFYVIDILVNIGVLIQSVLKFAGLFFLIKVEKAFNRELDYFQMIAHSGFVDICIICGCLATGISQPGLWLRLALIVLFTSSFLEQIPVLSIVMSCVQSGLKSVFFTVVVFFFIILVYASLGHFFFSENDPFHFGTYPLSVITFFQLSTFDNGAEVFSLNYAGCNSYPDTYYSTLLPNSNETHVSTVFGTFVMPLCLAPRGRPVESCVIFISFLLIEGYMIISMCLAAVAIGIDERLQSFKDLKIYGKGDDDEMPSLKNPEQLLSPARHTNSVRERASAVDKGKGGGATKVSKLLGDGNEDALLLGMLQKYWDGNDYVSDDSDSVTTSGGISWRKTSLNIKLVILGWKYEFFYSSLLLAAAVTQLYAEDASSLTTVRTLRWIYQACFFIDAALKIFVLRNSESRYFVDLWILSDIVLTYLLIIPLASPIDSNARFLNVVYIIRLVRVLKTFSFVRDLWKILGAVYNSFICVVYVVLLIAIFYVYYAIAGMILLRRATPYYFGDILPSIRSLLQIMTSDNWTYIMRTGMYGCSNFGFHSGVESYDNKCGCSDGDGSCMAKHVGVGYWSPIYCYSFSILSAMVLMNALVGVIITSMELLGETAREEEEVWSKARHIQRKYKMTGADIDFLLIVFEKLDKDKNGTLGFDEVTVALETMEDTTPQERFEFFLAMDEDRNGKIDFSEFCEMNAKLKARRQVELAKKAKEEKGTVRLRRQSRPQSSRFAKMIARRMSGRGKSGFFADADVVSNQSHEPSSPISNKSSSPAASRRPTVNFAAEDRANVSNDPNIESTEAVVYGNPSDIRRMSKQSSFDLASLFGRRASASKQGIIRVHSAIEEVDSEASRNQSFSNSVAAGSVRNSIADESLWESSKKMASLSDIESGLSPNNRMSALIEKIPNKKNDSSEAKIPFERLESITEVVIPRDGESSLSEQTGPPTRIGDRSRL